MRRRPATRRSAGGGATRKRATVVVWRGRPCRRTVTSMRRAGEPVACGVKTRLPRARRVRSSSCVPRALRSTKRNCWPSRCVAFQLSTRRVPRAAVLAVTTTAGSGSAVATDATEPPPGSGTIVHVPASGPISTMRVAPATASCTIRARGSSVGEPSTVVARTRAAGSVQLEPGRPANAANQQAHDPAPGGDGEGLRRAVRGESARRPGLAERPEVAALAEDADVVVEPGAAEAVARPGQPEQVA